MKTVIVELPIDEFTPEQVSEIREMEFETMKDFRFEISAKWYDIETFINGINNDSIDTENNWFAPVIIYN